MSKSSANSTRKKALFTFSGMNVNQVKLELTSQLNDKENALERIGISQTTRNTLIEQTEVIRKELLNLDQYQEEAELPTEIKSRLEVLANEFQFLKREKSNYSTLLPPAPSNSTPSKHRAKNVNGTQTRKPEFDFATEIGQGLVNEIRKLQVALQEKDEVIKQLELSRSDNHRSAETAQHLLNQKKVIEEELKEQLWNLEVANQELQANLSESNQLVAKHTSEYSKLSKRLKTQFEQLEIVKAQEEKSSSVIEAMKVRHEQEIYKVRRQAAVAQRENAQILKQVESLNTELKICKSKLAVKQAVSTRMESVTPEPEIIDKVVETPDDTLLTPQAAPPLLISLNQTLETETLKQSLAHAHRIILNLKNSSHKEKLEKFEVKKLLAESQESIEKLQKEMEDFSVGNIKKKKASFKKKRSRVARKPKGLAQDSDSDAKSNSDQAEGSEVEPELHGGNNDDNKSFMDPQFSLGDMFGTPVSFGASTMKSLSSELEANKVQLIDTGVNTDPVENDTSKQETDIALKDMISKIQAEKMLEELRSTIENDMIPRTLADTLIEDAVQKAKTEIQQAIHSQDTLRQMIEKELKEKMIDKTKVDALIDEAKQTTKLEDSVLKMDIENELKKNMILKSEVDSMLEDVQKKTKEEMQKSMITKDEAEAMVVASTKPLKDELEQYLTSQVEISERVNLVEEEKKMLLETFNMQKLELEKLRLDNLEQKKLEMQHLPREIEINELLERVNLVEQEKKALIETFNTQKLQLKKLRLDDLERQKLELQQIRKTELDHFALECQLNKESELKEQKHELEQATKTELEKQKLELSSNMEEQLKELEVSKKDEIATLLEELESQKKEYNNLKQQTLTMLTKEGADILVRNIEKKYEALEQERQEVAEREEQHMISKVEAEALAKVAAADAILKERQAMAAREEELISKEETDLRIQVAVKEAVDKCKEDMNTILTKERKLMKEKEEQLISKDEAEKSKQEAIQSALENFKKTNIQEDGIPSQTELKSQNMDISPEIPPIEKPRPILPAISLTPSMSTPVTTANRLRSSISAQSFLLGSDHRKSKALEKSDSKKSNTEASYGSIRVFDTSKYGKTHLNPKSSFILKGLSKKNRSTLSISTMSSNEDALSVKERMAIPMNSIESFAVFSDPSIDPEIIAAITQTMIGEWMFKHTRRYVGSGISEKKHKRFFWVHPYTKTLYWSSVQPGTEGSEGKTKSAFIESVVSVTNNNSADASPKSLLIRSHKRDIKITASSLVRHELWVKSLVYLLGKKISNSNSLEEEARTITSNFVENAGQLQQNTLKTKSSNNTMNDAQITEYDSDESEDVASIKQDHDSITSNARESLIDLGSDNTVKKKTGEMLPKQSPDYCKI